jgi:hypothetical protein
MASPSSFVRRLVCLPVAVGKGDAVTTRRVGLDFEKRNVRVIALFDVEDTHHILFLFGRALVFFPEINFGLDKLACCISAINPAFILPGSKGESDMLVSDGDIAANQPGGPVPRQAVMILELDAAIPSTPSPLRQGSKNLCGRTSSLK